MYITEILDAWCPPLKRHNFHECGHFAGRNNSFNYENVHDIILNVKPWSYGQT